MAETKPIDEVIEVNDKETEAQLAKPKLSELAGKLSSETADAMLEYVAISREEWEERMNKIHKFNSIH